MALIEGGYYIKAKRIQKSAIAKAPPHIRETWDWLLCNAKHKDVDGLKRGQIFTSYGEIAEGLAWFKGWQKILYKYSEIETAIDFLRRAKQIATQRTTRGVVITVLNYAKFQNPKNYKKEPETVTEIEIETVDETEMETAPIREEIRSKNKEIPIAAPAAVSAKGAGGGKPKNEIVSLFEVFQESTGWVPSYANKTERAAAAALLKAHTIDEIRTMLVLAKQISSDQYAPKVSKPSELADKWGKLERRKRELENPLEPERERRRRYEIEGDPAYKKGDDWYVIVRGEHKQWVGSRDAIKEIK